MESGCRIRRPDAYRGAGESHPLRYIFLLRKKLYHSCFERYSPDIPLLEEQRHSQSSETVNRALIFKIKRHQDIGI